MDFINIIVGLIRDLSIRYKFLDFVKVRCYYLSEISRAVYYLLYAY